MDSTFGGSSKRMNTEESTQKKYSAFSNKCNTSQNNGSLHFNDI